jgi:hypothetical protein
VMKANNLFDSDLLTNRSARESGMPEGNRIGRFLSNGILVLRDGLSRRVACSGVEYAWTGGRGRS